MKLKDIIDQFIAGDWGEETCSNEAPCAVTCIRGADIIPISEYNFSTIPIRYISQQSYSKKCLQVGDIIIEKSGGSDKFPVGRVIYFDGDENTYLFNNFTGLLRVKDKKVWYPKYVFYSLFANYRCGGTRAFENKTTGLHNLKIDDYISRYEVAEVDISKQTSICDKLDKLYGRIKSREQELQLLDTLIKARFVEMFGVYPENPKGWEICTIRDIVTDVRYGSSRPAVDGGKYPYLRMNNITYDGELDLSDIKCIDVPDNELDKCAVRRGDVLFNRTNSKELVGKTCVYNRDEMMVLAGFVIRVRVNNRILPEFLSAFLNTDFSKQMLLGMCKTAIGQANINARELQDIRLYLPPVELQWRYVQFKKQTDKSKVAVQAALDKTQLLFDSLMQEYFE